MKVIYYGTQRIVVADDVANEVSRAATEFGSAGRMIGLPIACYFQGRLTSLELVVGVGIPILIDQAEGQEALLPEPPETLRSWDFIRTETDNLQDSGD